jgi:uncharacterized membrane protein
MNLLVLGLIVFFGVHSIGMAAPAWRERIVARIGLTPWKGGFALISLIGLGLVVYGYGQARLDPIMVWQPPFWTRHIAAPLMLVAFICIAATYVPGSWIKTKFGHPMLAGVKTWSFAHLITNGMLADIALFGAFLAWSVLEFRIHRRRDKAAGTVYPRISKHRDLLVLFLGVAGALVFMFFLHQPLIGVRPY